VDFGVAIFPTDYSMNMARLATSVEERGFESLWVAEHTHIPARGSEGSQLPRHYSHTLDPFVALTAAATATAKLRVGTAICQVVEREPIVTAKAVASLDVVSGGRFLFGVGAGWIRDEMRNLGVNPAQRWEILREDILAMKQVWTREESRVPRQARQLPSDLVVAKTSSGAASTSVARRSGQRRD
jgi:alkanesulfonate monooxygenase SsuD/methylene tetrahydromethanopterin reductase-like flavin-dependent oxidoreductase (luciferase family)